MFVKDLFEQTIKGSFISIIKLYQLAISPLFKPTCRFYPSCSNYAIEAIKKKSLFYAGLSITSRVLRCNPLFKGGEDPVK